jgi:hypothetical protein
MDSRTKADDRLTMDVADWRYSPDSVAAKDKRHRGYGSPTLIGVVGTLLLHALVIQSVQHGMRGTQVRRTDMPFAGIGPTAQDDSVEGLVLITLSNADSDQGSVQNMVSSPLALSKLAIDHAAIREPPTFLRFESLTLGEEQSSHSASTGGDGMEQARLWGIYSGQIQARINRIWRRPRTAITEGNSAKASSAPVESFQCEAQIVQDAKGNVQEILLPRCNGSYAWQHSLVVAIQQASPLPAPPTPAVFSLSVTLNFVGVPYVDGASLDEYELESQSVARAD